MIMRTFKTTKGTELPLLNLRGKEYLEVKYRLVWFREEHPDWSIETELISVTDVSAYARARICDEKGRTISTSHKFESINGFPDFIEKAETGAIGRALALIGYGTQFCADELDEGQRIVDAPVDARHNRPELREATPVLDQSHPVENEQGESLPQPVVEPGEYRISFGRKYKGRKLKDIPKSEIESYIKWLESGSVTPGTKLSHHVQFLKDAFGKLYNGESASH